ncbi:MAG: N-acetyl-gamma-glutamyl-phosphate reductase [Pseudomonadota bacterium]
MSEIRVGIIGGTGYTGVELLRILVSHPNVKLTCISSRSEQGRPVHELFPSLRGLVNLNFSAPSSTVFSECDVVFSATPNGVAMEHAPALLDAGIRLIDLAADFRIKDTALWEKWYGMTHACPQLVEEAVYGLPEVYREQIRGAQLVANPGCYPTAVQLGFLPLLENRLVDPGSLIADAKSGISGAGRKAALGTAYAETADSFKAYGVPGHRHLPEIKQGLQSVATDPIDLVFTPHLLPLIRGIHATLYATLLDPSATDLQSVFEHRYADERFVDVMPEGSHPDTRSVRGSNTCRLAIHRPVETNRVVVLAVEDNLVKGAAGQAVQNMNIMFSLDEHTGLTGAALFP